MILRSVSGWVFTSASVHRHLLSFGLVDVPPLPIAQSDAAGARWHRDHVVGGRMLLGLVVLHVANALKHRFIDRDDVVANMLPGTGPR